MIKNTRTCLATLFALLLTQQAYANNITPTIELDKPKVEVKEKQTVYALVEFSIPEAKVDASTPKPPLNLSIVIDRSGSMEDKGKIEYAKQAANWLVDHLQPTDTLSIVEYDDQINVLWPASPVESKALIKKRIDSLDARGGTNLHGGMMKGVEEVQKKFNDKSLNRVILLSDGLANEGVKDPNEIKKSVRNTKGKGIQISALGLGLDYNEDLMQAIAENANGNYYFVESPKQMSRIFQQELDTLFTTIGKDVTITFEKTKHIKDIEVFGYLTSQKDNTTNIEMENFFSGEKRALLIRLEVEPQKTGKLDLGKLKLTYLDTATNKPINFTQKLTVNATKNKTDIEQAINKSILAEATLIEAEQKHEQYVTTYEKGDTKTALKNIKALTEELEAKNKNLNDIKVAKKIEALEMESEEIAQAEKDSKSRASYLKKSKKMLYSAKKGKRSKYLLQEGAKGYEVEQVQKALQNAGVYQGPVDGKYSKETTEAIKKFQKQQNITTDGIAGPKTQKALGTY